MMSVHMESMDADSSHGPGSWPEESQDFSGSPPGKPGLLLPLLVFLALSSGLIALALWQPPLDRPLNTDWWRSMDRWLFPLEVNTQRKKISINTNLHGIAFADADHAVAVGSSGIILRSGDGGTTWEYTYSGTDEDLTSIIFLDINNAVAVGDNGTIIISSDGGHNWKKVDNNSQSHLYHIANVGGDQDYAVGFEGNILRSDDKGKTWKTINSTTNSNLASIDSDDIQTFVSVGDSGTIVRTENGGMTWHKIDYKIDNDLYSISFIDSSKIVTVGSNGIIIRSEDSGKTWQTIESVTKSTLTSIAHTNTKHAVAVGWNGTILESNDTGITWKNIESGTKNNLYNIAFSDENHAVAVGQSGTIILSDDGGKTWHIIAENFNHWISSIAFSDTDNAVAFSSKGTILNGYNGGKEWVYNESNTKAFLNSIAFGDANHAIAVGFNGIIIRSEDSGKTWHEVISGTFNDLTSIAFSDSDHAVAVGENCTILYTNNSGISWQKISTEMIDYLNSVSFIDINHAIAVGDNGTVITSKDGGKTWRKHMTGYGYDFTYISSFNTGNAVLFEAGGNIYLSDDSGETWEKVATENGLNIMSIAFADANNVVAVGMKGAIRRSEDSGKTWQKVDSGTNNTLNSIAFSDADHAVAVGHEGTILRTDDGGKTWIDNFEYRKIPAFWLYPALFLNGAACLSWARRREQRSLNRASSIADKVISDNPIESPDLDKLRMVELAQGLSRFIRNSATVPPLAVSVSGCWGSGKSSLMRLARKELVKSGVYPVWFNAWHHQKEPSLLAVLLETIRQQAVPDWRHPFIALRFRLRLTWLRAKQSPWQSAGIVFLLVAGVTICLKTWPTLGWSEYTGQAIGVFGRLLEHKTPWGEALVSLLSSPHLLGLLVLFVALIVVWNSSLLTPELLAAFPLSPGKLLAAMSGTFKWTQAEEQTAFRNRFAKQFHGVCKALAPRHPVIFIDDLDRCQPDKALEALEAVNYIVTSGDCFVILGLDKDRVEKCVGLVCALQAKEMEPEKKNAEGQADEKAQRQLFAQHYLEKLLNLDISLKPLDAETARALLEERTTNPVQFTWLDHVCNAVEKAWTSIRPAATVLLPACLAVWLGYLTMDWGTTAFQEMRQAAERVFHAVEKANSDAPAPQKEKISVDPIVPPRPPNPDEPRTKDSAAIITPPRRAGMNRAEFYFLGAIVLAGGILLVLTRLRYSWLAFEVEDSKDFRNALAIWAPVVAEKNPTPRGVKRFINRSRYYAMRQRGMRDQSTPTQFLFHFVQGNAVFTKLVQAIFPGYNNVSEGIHASTNERSLFTIDEATLVALAAIYETRPESFNDDGRLYPITGKEKNKLDDIIEQSSIHHNNFYHSVYITDQSEVKRFLSWAK